MFVYQRNEDKKKYEVGFVRHMKFVLVETVQSKAKAQELVHYLNGGEKSKGS